MNAVSSFLNREARLLTATLLVVTAVVWPECTVTVRADDDARASGVLLGSQTAKGGFRNEEDVCAAFNHWKTDADARGWLETMHGSLDGIDSVVASIPRGEKAKTDVEVRVTSGGVETRYGISIKLVSTTRGFNQIDKRWLASYAEMWDMPPDVHEALKLFVGEVPPTGPSRRDDRMFLTELPAATQTRVVEFFTDRRAMVASQLFSGGGDHAADWLLVTVRDRVDNETPEDDDDEPGVSGEAEAAPFDPMQSVLIPTAEAAEFYAHGDVAITAAGNLRIGRITMQRKGGDGGRDTAKMLQFKIDPTALFDRDASGSLDAVSRPVAKPVQQ